MAGPGAPARTASPLPTVYSDANGQEHPTNPQYSGASVDLAGTLWLSSRDSGVPVTRDGLEHSQAAAIRALWPIRTSGRGVIDLDQRSVAVVDAETVLAGTYNPRGATFWRADDVMVYRVAGGRGTVVAGHPGSVRPTSVSDLTVGVGAPTADVSLGLIQAVTVLSQSSFLILMTAPTSEEDATEARLQAAVVQGGSIRRLALPDLCAGDNDVVASRVNDATVVISAPKAAENGDCRRTDLQWLELDVRAGSSTLLGSGPGYAYVDGDRLVTAVATSPSWAEWSIAWR